MKKRFVLSILLASTAWAGWHMTPQDQELATDEADKHVHRSACVQVYGSNRQGSGVFIESEGDAGGVIATAAHVVAPYDDAKTLSKGPFKAFKPDIASLFVSFGKDVPDIHSVFRIYYTRERDVAFMMLNGVVNRDKYKPAPVISADAFEEATSCFDRSNMPRLAGYFKNDGIELNYMGCGHALTPWQALTKPELAQIQIGAYMPPTSISDKRFRLGRVQISQRFDQTLYSWMSVNVSGRNTRRKYSVSLPGDSGGGAFTTDDAPALIGLVSKGHTSDSFEGKKVAGTEFTGLHTGTLSNGGSLFEDFLRLYSD